MNTVIVLVKLAILAIIVNLIMNVIVWFTVAGIKTIADVAGGRASINRHVRKNNEWLTLKEAGCHHVGVREHMASNSVFSK